MKIFILLVIIGAAFSQGCVDQSGDINCQSWKRNNAFCSKNYADQYCAKTCGRCSGPSCGISLVPQSRIINGVTATPGAWPWIASFQRNRRHFCGATLLTPKWVLTASHCVENVRNIREYTIVLGAHNHGARESSVQRISIRRIIKHPSYSRRTLLADLAMIELAQPAKLNNHVGVPCLPKSGVYPSIGGKCYLAGWGSMRHPGSSVNILQQTALPVVQGYKCKHQSEVVCVGNGFRNQPNGKQQPNACRGDSGGPLVCQQSNGKWQLEGVASYVYTYCKYYTGYAPVNKYLGWINGYLRQ